jgi:opacity protein-like surface antigen
MMRTLRAMGLAAAMLAMPAMAAAAEDDNPKLYGTLGGLWAIDAFDIDSTANAQNSYGLDTRVGYRFHENLAAELQYQWAARFETTQGGVQLGTIATHTGTANIKAGLMATAFQPYLLFGVGVVNGQRDPGRDVTEFGLRVGGGLQWFVTRNVGFYGELTYVQPFGSLRDFASVPIGFGAAFRF